MSGREQAARKRALPEIPFISVILPVRNEERFIADTLAQLQVQSYPRDRMDFLVCDGMSDDRTRQIVSQMGMEDPRIQLLDNNVGRSSAGRNIGFRAARGDAVLVIDGHVEIPSDQLIANVAECFQRSGADCLGRPQPLVPTEGKPWSEAIAFARFSRLGHNPGSFIYSDYEGFAPAASMGAAYRPHVFEEIGFVDESFDACEDLEFNTRLDKAGLRCFVSPKLTVSYFARTSPWRLFLQLYRYGYGRFKYLTRHPDRISLGQLAPPVLVTGLASIPLLWLFARPLAVVAVALAGLYVLAVVLGALVLSVQSMPRHFLRYLVVLPIVHLAVGVGFLASLVRGGKLRVFRQRDEAAEE